MATAQLTETQETALSVMPEDKRLALEAVIAEAKMAEVEYENRQRESQTLASVEFGPKGLVCNNLAGLWRLANMFAGSKMIPEHFQGQPNDCLIALQMAQRCGVDPYMFMQNSYVVYGKPGIEAKMAIAMLNTSGKITGRISYELTGEGKKRQCTASVTDKESGEKITTTVDWATVEAEGWDKPKKGTPSKWMTIPDMMFKYRSAMFLIRTHYPEVLMGLQTVDELEDIETTEALQVEETRLIDNRSKSDRIADELAGRSQFDDATRPFEGGKVNGPASESEPKAETAADAKEQETKPKAEAKSEKKPEPKAKADDAKSDESDKDPLATLFEKLAYGVESSTDNESLEASKSAVVEAYTKKKISKTDHDVLLKQVTEQRGKIEAAKKS